MPAHVWRPASGSGPGILLLQEIFGVSDYIVSRAQDLAGLGYVVLAPEIYWRIGASRVENGPDALEQAFGLAQQVDWDAAVSDSAVGTRGARPAPGVDGGTGIVGFCFGGALAFNVAAVDRSRRAGQLLRLVAAEHAGPRGRRDGSRALPLRAGGQLHRARDGGADPEGTRPPAARHLRDLRGRRPRLRQPRLPAAPPAGVGAWRGSARSRSSTGTCHRDDRPGGPRRPGAAGTLGGQLRRPPRRDRARRRRWAADGARSGRLDVRGRRTLRQVVRRTGRSAAFAASCTPPDRWGVLLVRKGGFAIARLHGAARSSSPRSGSATSRAGPRPAVRASNGSPDVGTTRPASPTRQPPGTPRGSSPEPLAALVCGGDRTAVEQVLEDPRLQHLAGVRVDPWLAVPDPRRAVLEQAVADAARSRSR